jgi:hypothetical protein
VVVLRHRWGDPRVYYYNERGNLTSMPARWTSAVAPDPVAAISAGRSHFRVQDLLELAELMSGIAGSSASGRPARRGVKEKTP